jgi:hypothetical protein
LSIAAGVAITIGQVAMLTEDHRKIYPEPASLFDMTENNKTSRDPSRVGLCADCLYAQQIESVQGSMFYLCKRSASDQRFQKYPRLPVVRCSGYRIKNLA